jgi:hypothetical protein
MKNAVFRDVTQCGSCKNYVVFLRSLRRLLVTANVVPSSPILAIPIMEALCSSKMSVLTRAAWGNNPEDGILHSHRRGNLKYYKEFLSPTPALGLTQPPIQRVERAVSPGIKRPRREANRSPPTSVEAKKTWICISTPQHRFLA